MFPSVVSVVPHRFFGLSEVSQPPLLDVEHLKPMNQRVVKEGSFAGNSLP